MNEIGTRGVQDILIISVDNLKGFSEAIKGKYPNSEIQKCIVHQIRNSIKYVASKDMKEFTKDLKTVYKAITLEQAESNLLHLEEKWGKKYKAALKSWNDNWEELTTYFKYPEEIRKLIYTTNSIENFNRQLRKYTKTKSIYLSIKEITKKWTGKVQNWGQIVSQLSIYFEGRI